MTWLFRITFWLLAELLVVSLVFCWSWVAIVALGAATGAALISYIRTLAGQIRYFEPDPSRPLNLWNPLNWRTAYAHSHRAYWRKQHYDRWLSLKVRFARHALAIDESRADFPRVAWAMPGTADNKRDQKPEWLKQVWFAGCHSDIGGSYPEDESRLSDIALRWMVDELKECLSSVCVRDDMLCVTPDPRGLQHDEVWMVGSRIFRLRYARKPRIVDNQIPLHPTMLKRLKAQAVPKAGEMMPCRAVQLAGHPEARQFYSSRPA